MDGGTKLQVLHEQPFEPRFVTADPRLRRLIERAHKFAAQGLSVCVLGESGTGKSLLAADLHENSGRSGPLNTVECPSIAENLAESELFGHVRGAFTGAVSDRTGPIELANGGAVFLDEIGDLPSTLQSKLLRATQDGIIRKVGSSEDIQIDVQWFTATNADLIRLVQTGKFREDLYFRLCDYAVTIPSLRDRKDDIPALAAEFLTRQKIAPERLTDGALEALQEYSWPGNARELERVLRRSRVLADEGPIEAEHLELSEKLGERLRRIPTGEDPGIRVGDTVGEARGKLIRATLAACEDNQSAAADLLGMSRGTLSRLLRRFDQ